MVDQGRLAIATRGKTKVDLLGDAFAEFFLRKDAYRKEGEEINDFETRYGALVRKSKTLAAVRSEGKISSRRCMGGFFVNAFMKLEASGTANARGTSMSCKLEDALHALHSRCARGRAWVFGMPKSNDVGSLQSASRYLRGL